MFSGPRPVLFSLVKLAPLVTNRGGEETISIVLFEAKIGNVALVNLGVDLAVVGTIVAGLVVRGALVNL